MKHYLLLLVLPILGSLTACGVQKAENENTDTFSVNNVSRLLLSEHSSFDQTVNKISFKELPPFDLYTYRNLPEIEALIKTR